MNEKYVQIPLSLMNEIIELLAYWDISNYADDFKADYEYVLTALLEKRAKLKLREAYSRIIFANDDDARHSARVEYLKQKRSF